MQVGQIGVVGIGSVDELNSIVDAIEGMPSGPVRVPEDDDAKMRDIAVFSNLLCDALANPDADEADQALAVVIERFEPSVGIDSDYALKLVNAGFEKLKQYSQIFEIDVSRSSYCQSVQRWLDDRIGELEPAASDG